LFRLVFILAGCCGAAVAAAVEPAFNASERSHWSFQPRLRPRPPEFDDLADRNWVANEIDAFVLARLKEFGLRPAPEADRRTLARRVYFDLIGLPPTPAELTEFLTDPSPCAYELLIDRLLASPRYGERWGRHWLDVVRYAETEGFEYDNPLSGTWRYRDYVIQAFNDDLPFDRFVREQIAGDELTGDDPARLVAAGFHRLGPVRRNAGNQRVAGSRNEVLTEETNAIGSVFLGLTIGCARCHDHMFDPIRQTDYYRLEAFLAASQERNVSLASPEERAAWQARTDEVQAECKKLKELRDAAPGEQKQSFEAQIEAAESRLPAPLPEICTVENRLAERTPIHVLGRGDADHPGEMVGMRAPGVLLPEGTPDLPADTANPRTRLADWLTDAAHPLTARVLVNRIWQYHFGRGIVATANDFGVNGDRPSHPELLDWLANRFVDEGWSIKSLHRVILLSRAYRQASRSADEPAAHQRDPDNRLLWRSNRRRLEAEELRDAMLSVAGVLNVKSGGPSVVVAVDRDLVELLYKPGQWAVTPDAAEHRRRSVYLLAKRNLRLPFMEVFDQPDTQTSCARRESSTHAPQALELTNGKLSNELAVALAERLAREAGTDPSRQVELAFALVAGRPPNDVERRRSLEFLRDQPLAEFALAMFNLNAFLYVD